MNASDPLSLNLYTYCCNNPVMYVDPSGHIVTEWDREHLTSDELAQLKYMSNQWFEVSSKEQIVYASIAESIRSKYRQPFEYTTKDGITYVSKDVPPTEADGYIAPRNGPRSGKTADGKRGWVDKNGNIWVPAPDGSPQAHGGGHWDVERPDGNGYTNRYPGGKERAGKGKRPNIPEPSTINQGEKIAEAAGTGAAIVVGGYVLWKVIKWGVATVLAPETGGLSYGVAAVLP